ncbi:MAG TPA: NADH-quinone oxidoreductase subunit I [Chitinophagaceae bacterium]|nr:MAG: NADH dehydrogenase subunit I [Bacteroidetes bacterium OLB11]HMN31978.1 NADH-quinone oxidoreductase subunit I [Chitinophagaceae bacterium]
MIYNISKKAIPVNRTPLSLYERTYIPSIAKGLAVTIKHIFQKKATVNFPEVERPFSSTFRGLHILNRDEEDRERCTACGLCALSCPAEAITMEAAERLPSEEHLYREEKYAASYEINMLRCIFCGLCEEACPKDAIYLTQTFAPANYTRESFIYKKEDLLIPKKSERKETVK